MKHTKKMLALSFAVFTGTASMSASAAIIDGINWGPAGSTHLETTTLAEQFINPATTAPGTGAGMGYGYVTTINGDINYCAGGCGLFFTVSFYGGTFTSATDITFTGTDVTLYKLPSIPNLLAQDSATNLATITAGTVHTSLVGHGDLGGGLPANVVSEASGTLSGATLNLLGSGLLDVVSGSGLAADFLDGDGIPDAAGGFADFAYTESANNFALNPFDVTAGLANGCLTGLAATGAWCWQGTLNTRGVSEVAVPEPAMLSMLALGLIGAGAVARRRRSV